MDATLEDLRDIRDRLLGLAGDAASKAELAAARHKDNARTVLDFVATTLAGPIATVEHAIDEREAVLRRRAHEERRGLRVMP